MSKRILVTLSDPQALALSELMREDIQANTSAYIGLLIGAEVRRRAESKDKRGPGRPRNPDAPSEPEQEADYSDDLPKDNLHFGRMIGKRELKDIEDRHAEFIKTQK